MVLAVISFFRKKEDFKFNFQSWSTFKKVQKIWIIELLSIDYHEKEKKIESNLYKKNLFRITVIVFFSLNFFIKTCNCFYIKIDD